MRTHYDNLYVGEKATPEVIKAAYKVLAQKWHPDKHPDQRAKAERYFKIINQAFEVLSDPEQRAAYDLWLSRERNDKETHGLGSERSYPETSLQPESVAVKETHNSPEVEEPQDRSGQAAKKIKDSDIWFLKLWTYLILPVPSLVILLVVLLNSSHPSTYWPLMFNFQQLTFFAFSGFLIFGLHARWLLAWRLSWLALLAAPALVLQAAGYGGFAAALCGLWMWWSISAWLRIKPLFITLADWYQLQEQAGQFQKKTDRVMYKPLKGKIWNGWKGFFYSYLFFIPVWMSSDEIGFGGALLFSFFIAALIGAMFAALSDWEIEK